MKIYLEESLIAFYKTLEEVENSGAPKANFLKTADWDSDIYRLKK